jgi:hypothetical protein
MLAPLDPSSLYAAYPTAGLVPLPVVVQFQRAVTVMTSHQQKVVYTMLEELWGVWSVMTEYMKELSKRADDD